MSSTEPPKDWHKGPDDGFHGQITPDGYFPAERDRYHFYYGLFCPFAHRANIIISMLNLQEHAGITSSIVRPYPKGEEGWRFNVAGEDVYEDATVDHLYGSRFFHNIYFKADPNYKGKYSVPVIWDKKRETIVNNESLELLRDLPSAFQNLMPSQKPLELYSTSARSDIDRIGAWMQRDLNTGVYKAGFARSQEDYEKGLLPVFGALNALEKLISERGGPYVLGDTLTELDLQLYCTIIRFDVAYVQHFKTNLSQIRDGYPVLQNWLLNLYWNVPGFRETTNFRHIKENYTKSHADINPLAITPLGPWPEIAGRDAYQQDWAKLRRGGVDMPAVTELAEKLS